MELKDGKYREKANTDTALGMNTADIRDWDVVIARSDKTRLELEKCPKPPNAEKYSGGRKTTPKHLKDGTYRLEGAV